MKLRGTIVFTAGVLAALGAGWAGFPRVIYQTHRQPVDFSHQVHADKAGSKCDDCHAFRADGTFAGVPTLDKCSGCHAAAMGTTVAEKTFIDNYRTPHSDKMHVVERFTRQGDALLYGVTVEDPEVLVEPWVLPTRTVLRSPNPDAGLVRERGNCEVFETEAVSSQIRH